MNLVGERPSCQLLRLGNNVCTYHAPQIGGTDLIFKSGGLSAEKHNQAQKSAALSLFRWSSLLVKDQKAWSGLHANTIVVEVNGPGIIGQLPTITVTPTNTRTSSISEPHSSLSHLEHHILT